MKGNEKLLAARARIEDILKEYDIAGHVVLHMPGFVEVFKNIEPSYCKVRFVEHAGGLELRMRSKVADYGGDRDAQRRDLEATANLFASMGQALGQNAMVMLKASEVVDAACEAEHTTLRKVPDDPDTKLQ